MTDAEWQTSTDASAMYRLLHKSQTLMKTRWLGWVPVRCFRFSSRHDTLFRCAVSAVLVEIVAVEAVRVLVETLRDRQFEAADADSLGRALLAFDREVPPAPPRQHAAAWAALQSLRRADITADWLFDAAVACADTEAPHGDLWERAQVYERERVRQADLLREFAGNPFHEPRLPKNWEHWHDGALRQMAEGIDVCGDFEALPILGDALEDAGCIDPEILAHCRKRGPHQRGCWVLDLLLGRE